MGMTLATSLERQVLSAMMQSSRAISEAEEILQPEDFADGRHEILYRTIRALSAESSPTDPIALCERLERDGELKRIGGEALLWELHGECITPDTCGYYAQRLKEVSVERRLLVIGKELAAAAEAHQGDPEALRFAAMRQIEELWQPQAARASEQVADLVGPALDSLDEIPRYMPTPWLGMNKVLDGWRPGGLYIIGARPSVGKSVMGLQAASWLAVQGPVLFVSLEMAKRELLERMLASASGVSLTSIVRRTLTEEQKRNIAMMSERVRTLALSIYDGGIRDMNDLRALASSLRRERGAVRAIVIDYLQLIRLKSGKSRWEEVGEISSTLKELAKEYDCPVIALAQLNRNSVSGDRAPQISDLRESGSIEQDADVVLLLQRDDDDIEGETVMKVRVAKNRQGRTGEFSLLFERHVTRLSDM